MAFMTRIETHTQEDAEGNITETKKETTSTIEKNNEPDYIKIYTRMWTEFNQIPTTYRELFLQLTLRMTYADATDKANSQIVHTGGLMKKAIMKALNLKADSVFYKGLQELVNCNAIKKISRGQYQINPSYAGKGEWKYNPRLKRGGIEDIVTTFSLKDKTVDTKFVWADDGEPTEFNEMYRQGMGVKASDETVLTHTVTIPTKNQNQKDLPPQEELTDLNPITFDTILESKKWNGKIYRDNKIYLDGKDKILSNKEADLLKTHPNYTPYKPKS